VWKVPAALQTTLQKTEGGEKKKQEGLTGQIKRGVAWKKKGGGTRGARLENWVKNMGKNLSRNEELAPRETTESRGRLVYGEKDMKNGGREMPMGEN